MKPPKELKERLRKAFTADPKWPDKVLVEHDHYGCHKIVNQRTRNNSYKYYLHLDEAVPREQYDRVVGLLEKLIGRVNRVTSRHLHKGVEVTEQDLNRLVDCQHEVEEMLKDESKAPMP